MPIGAFLDTFPTMMFVIIHAILLLIGLWAIKKSSDNKAKYAKAFWLYVLVHISFLFVFGEILTLKMGVFIEQILILIMVLWIVMKS